MGPRDIQAAILPIKTAAGQDGRDIRAVPLVALQVVVNLLMLLRHMPFFLRNARTIFVPKTACVFLATVFRPNSIASVLTSPFHKILARRILASVDLDHRQRAFLQARRPLYMAFVDIAKAFDSVQIGAILRGIARKGGSTVLLDYIQEFYQTAQTELQFEKAHRLVCLTRGIPSPCLFNLVLEE